MILTRLDIDEFEEEYSDYQLDYGSSTSVTDDPSDSSRYRFHQWLSNNPQVLCGGAQAVSLQEDGRGEGPGELEKSSIQMARRTMDDPVRNFYQS